MKKLRQALMAVLVVALVGCSNSPATIEKKNGEVVKGVIQGMIMQGECRHSGQDKDSTGQESLYDLAKRLGFIKPLTAVDTTSYEYEGLYYLAEGSQIGTIDETGVRYQSGIRHFYVRMHEPIDPWLIASFCLDMDRGDVSAVLNYSKEHGGTWVNTESPTKLHAPANLTLLGEYRQGGKDDKGKIVPTITVKTATGTMAIPIAEIVEFQIAER